MNTRIIETETGLANVTLNLESVLGSKPQEKLTTTRLSFLDGDAMVYEFLRDKFFIDSTIKHEIDLIVDGLNVVYNKDAIIQFGDDESNKAVTVELGHQDFVVMVWHMVTMQEPYPYDHEIIVVKRKGVDLEHGKKIHVRLA